MCETSNKWAFHTNTKGYLVHLYDTHWSLTKCQNLISGIENSLLCLNSIRQVKFWSWAIRSGSQLAFQLIPKRCWMKLVRAQSFAPNWEKETPNCFFKLLCFETERGSNCWKNTGTYSNKENTYYRVRHVFTTMENKFKLHLFWLWEEARAQTHTNMGRTNHMTSSKQTVHLVSILKAQFRVSRCSLMSILLQGEQI